MQCRPRRDFGIRGLEVKSRSGALDLARNTRASLDPSPNHSRLGLLSHCLVLAQERMLQAVSHVSSVASRVKKLMLAYRREEGSRRYHHHHLIDLRVSPRVRDKGLHVSSVVSRGT